MVAKLKILRWLGIICFTFVYAVAGFAPQGNDAGKIVIRSASGETVLSVSGKLFKP